MSEARPLTVAIDLRLPGDGSVGGVGWVTQGLVAALAALPDGDERYLTVGRPGQRAGLAEALGSDPGRVSFVAEGAPPLSRARQALGDLLRRTPGGQRLLRAGFVRLTPPRDPRPDPLIESLGCDLVHFPTQRFHPGARPSVYNPHDLQHLHYPRFFSRGDRARRERLYRAGCQGARRIAVSSGWVARDLIAQYGVSAAKVQVIPWGIDPNPGTPAPADLAAWGRRLAAVLPATQAATQAATGSGTPYALYPAATWGHKNHLALIEALARVRAEGVDLALVCCGHRTDLYPRLVQRVHALGLGERVAFTGVLPRGELDAAYQGALCVLVPSLFEASSALIREAWRWRVPVACSAVTSLPEQAGDAALLFDPGDPGAMAAALGRLARDPGLRADLVGRGARRVARFPWDRTARAYRALYRSAAGLALGGEDLDLLATDWMTSP